jgi:hypothetical protein
LLCVGLAVGPGVPHDVLLNIRNHLLVLAETEQNKELAFVRFKSTCGERFGVQIRHTPAWRSTSVGK